jgi:hypothetical protein
MKPLCYVLFRGRFNVPKDVSGSRVLWFKVSVVQGFCGVDVSGVLWFEGNTTFVVCSGGYLAYVKVPADLLCDVHKSTGFNGFSELGQSPSWHKGRRRKGVDWCEDFVVND